jgi:hypothetical protein
MKIMLVTFLFFVSFNSEASIFCHTPRMNKIFEVSEKNITFFNEFETGAKRELASVSSKSKPNGTGVTKIVDFENQKHIIHITDLNSFSEINDYIIIKSRSGHEVTYPLTCEKK